MNVPYNYNEFVFRAGLKRVKLMDDALKVLEKLRRSEQIDRSIFKVK